MVKHILDTRQFKDREFLEAFFDRTDHMARDVRNEEATGQKLSRPYEGKTVASLFYQPSTRTKMLLDSAAKKLGAQVIGTENAREFSSAFKGETLEHSMQATEYGFDVAVLRHPQNGSAKRAASVSKKPVINAGDGTNQHPIQALTDLYTMMWKFGRIDDLKIGFVGDMEHGRTVKSLVYLLAHLNNHRLSFVAPEELAMPADIRAYLREKSVRFDETDDLDKVLPNVDALYVTRLQLEYVRNPFKRWMLKKSYRDFQITPERADMMTGGSVIMHPLPINTEKSNGYPEITGEVDSHPRACYFEQSNNKLYVGMAMFDALLGRDRYLRDMILDPSAI